MYLIFLFCRMGIAYAGTNRDNVLSLLIPVISDPKSNMEVRLYYYFLKQFYSYLMQAFYCISDISN